jgi:hypothetical protein
MRLSIILPILTTITLVSFGTAAQARTVTGPNGSTATGTARVVNDSNGSQTAKGAGSFSGANGSSGSGKVQVQTNGQGSVTAKSSGTVTTPAGTTYTGTRNGTKTYTPEAGYSGNQTTTVNGKIYSTSTQDGVSTIATPQGAKTIIYPIRQR